MMSDGESVLYARKLARALDILNFVGQVYHDIAQRGATTGVRTTADTLGEGISEATECVRLALDVLKKGNEEGASEKTCMGTFYRVD